MKTNPLLHIYAKGELQEAQAPSVLLSIRVFPPPCLIHTVVVVQIQSDTLGLAFKRVAVPFPFGQWLAAGWGGCLG